MTISVVTGLLQFAPRASYTAPSGVFQLKMSLLLVAVIYQFTIDRLVGTGAVSNARWIRVAGTVGALIWLSLALTACWFILFE